MSGRLRSQLLTILWYVELQRWLLRSQVLILTNKVSLIYIHFVQNMKQYIHNIHFPCESKIIFLQSLKRHRDEQLQFHSSRVTWEIQFTWLPDFSTWHCLKCVQIEVFFWSFFSMYISRFSLIMGKCAPVKNCEIGHFTQCE